MRFQSYIMLALAALLVGASGTAFAGTPCGTNLEYDLDGTVLRLTSPDPTQPAQIQSMVFKDSTTITSVTIPDNVTLIGGQAFMGCTALTNVDLGSVQNIGPYAFKGCTALTEIVIPPSDTIIGAEAFYGCSSLVSVLCRPYTAPTLGTDGFTGCHTDLKICVPARGEYNGKTNWTSYYENKVILCFLDENDEQSTTSSKIKQFRDTDRTFIDIFRTLRKAGCFNTLTLPFNVTNIASSPLGGDNVAVYTFVGAAVESGTLRLDITPVTSNTLTAGTPYLIQWDNTGEVLNHMHFTDITWDNNETADNAGTGEVELHGFYGKTHINDSTENGVNTAGDTHLNLFLQGGNQLYWPSDGNDADAKMLGFRAWFRINGNTVAGAPVRRGMPASLNIVPAPATPTAVEETATTDSAVSVTKELQNGHLIIIRNGVRYSINGQRL